jgi:hypothetical protein
MYKPSRQLMILLSIVMASYSGVAQGGSDVVSSRTSEPRLTIKGLINPSFYNDLGLSRRDATRHLGAFYTNVEVDYRFSQSLGVVGMLYNSRYNMDRSIPIISRMCVDAHWTHIAGLAVYRRLPIRPRLTLLPRIGLSSTRDVLVNSTSAIGVCVRPPLSGTRMGLIAGLELRYELLHGVNLSFVAVGNTMLSRNIRHLMLSPALSISF